jgi:hypothetical protein
VRFGDRAGERLYGALGATPEGKALQGFFASSHDEFVFYGNAPIPMVCCKDGKVISDAVGATGNGPGESGHFRERADGGFSIDVRVDSTKIQTIRSTNPDFPGPVSTMGHEAGHAALAEKAFTGRAIPIPLLNALPANRNPAGGLPNKIDHATLDLWSNSVWRNQ